MPDLARITSTFFVNLINRLGVRPPPADGFLLSNVVQPISLVDSDITLSAISTTQVLDAANTAGEQVTPVANTVLADTGALAAGNYSIVLMIGRLLNGATSGDMKLQRRDAANAANIWSQLIGGVGTGEQDFIFMAFTCTLALNERIRVIEAANATATVQATIWVRAA